MGYREVGLAASGVNITDENVLPEAVRNQTMVCQHYNSRYTGVWHSESPFRSLANLFFFQITVFVFLSRFLHLLLQPLGQLQVISQLVTGFLLGRSCLGDSHVASVLFPAWGYPTMKTVTAFGVMILHFALGVKMDTTMLINPGRKAMMIGSTMFLLPLTVMIALTIIFKSQVTMGPTLAKALPFIALTQPLTGLPTVFCLLSELRLLNTDIGRLALASSQVSDIVGMILASLAKVTEENKTGHPVHAIMAGISSVILLLMIACIGRPLVLWMIYRTPQGRPMKEVHLVSIFVIVMVTGLASECIGQRYFMGPLFLGFLVPDGPPLGTAIEHRIETFVLGLLCPAFICLCGMEADIFNVASEAWWLVGSVVIFSYVIKLAVVMLSALYCKLSSKEAFVLGLMMNVKGIIELVIYSGWRDNGILGNQEFSLCIAIITMVTALSTPAIRVLYSSNKQYVTVKRCTIQHAKPDSDLRVLVCVYDHETIPTIINLLEASHASKESPVVVMAMTLVELAGRATPILVNHKNSTLNTTQSTSDHILINALRKYEHHNQGSVTLETFTAITDFPTMHDDICQVAMEEWANIVIVPFHKQWGVDGSVYNVNGAIRTMNLHVLEKAPCSVGILIDRGTLGTSLPIMTSNIVYHVAVLFIGGLDDVEALAYGCRMVKHRKVTVTVIRFLLFGTENSKERKHDSELIYRYWQENMRNERFTYMEEIVRDGVGLATFLKQLVCDFDLILVGREHPESPIFIGLDQWNECPELGVVPDMLASADFGSTASVLVIQQQRICVHSMSRSSERAYSVHGDEPPRGSCAISIASSRREAPAEFGRR